MRISYTDEYGKHDIGLPDGLSDSDLQGAIAAYRQTYARPSIPPTLARPGGVKYKGTPIVKREGAQTPMKGKEDIGKQLVTRQLRGLNQRADDAYNKRVAEIAGNPADNPNWLGSEQQAMNSYTAGGTLPGPGAPKLGGYANAVKHAGMPYQGAQKMVGEALTRGITAQQRLAGQPKKAQITSLPKKAQDTANEAIGTAELNVAPMASGSGAAINAGFALGSSNPFDMFTNLAQVGALEGIGHLSPVVKKFFAKLAKSPAAAKMTAEQAEHVARSVMEAHDVPDSEIERAITHLKGLNAKGKPVYRVPGSASEKPLGETQPVEPPMAETQPAPAQVSAPQVNTAKALPKKPKVFAKDAALLRNNPEPVGPQPAPSTPPAATPATPPVAATVPEPERRPIEQPPVTPTGSSPLSQQTSAEGDVFTNEFMPTSDLNVLPGMQFKKQGVHDTKNQVTDLLKNVDVYDHGTGSPLTVWEDKEGKRWVMNGHHRLELAKRTGEPHLPVKVYREANGMGFNRARSIGALQNIKDDKGSAIDAATVMRDLGASVDQLKRWGVNTRKGMARNAVSLLKMSPEGIKAVEEGEIPEAVGAGIADSGLDPEKEAIAIRKAREGNLETRSQAEFLSNRLKQRSTVQKPSPDKVSLFDTGMDINDVPLAEEAKIADAASKRMVQDKNRYKNILRGTAAGNTAVDESAQEQAVHVQEWAQRMMAYDPETSKALEEEAINYAKNPNAKTFGSAVDRIVGTASKAADAKLKSLLPRMGEESSHGVPGERGESAAGTLARPQGQLMPEPQEDLKLESEKEKQASKPKVEGGQTAFDTTDTDGLFGVPDEPKKGFGSKNTKFTKAKLDESVKKLSGDVSANPFADPEKWRAALNVGGYYLEGGIREFGAWCKAFRDVAGDHWSDAHLKAVWDHLHEQGARSGSGVSGDGNEEPVDNGASPKPSGVRESASPTTGEGNDQRKPVPADSSGGTGEPSGSPDATGLANQVQERHVEDGTLPRAPEGGAGRTRASLHEGGNEFKNLDDAEALGSKIKHGMPEQTKNFELANKANQLFVKETREAAEAHAKLIADGAPAGEIAHAAEKVAKLEARHIQFLDDVQQGKGEWSNVGRALQDGRNIETGSFAEVIHKSTSNKGEALTSPEREWFKGQIAERDKQNEILKKRADDLEKAAKGEKKASRIREENQATRREQSTRQKEAIRKTREDAIARLKARKKPGTGMKSRQSGAISLPDLSKEDLADYKTIIKSYVDEGVLTAKDVAAEMSEALGQKLDEADLVRLWRAANKRNPSGEKKPLSEFGEYLRDANKKAATEERYAKREKALGEKLGLPDKEFMDKATEEANRQQALKVAREAYAEQQAKVTKIQAKIRQRMESLRPQNAWEKTANALRGDVALSGSAWSHLFGSSVGAIATRPIEDLVGRVVSVLPGGGGKTLGQIAAEESGGHTLTYYRSMFSREAVRNAFDQITKGMDAIDAASGKSEFAHKTGLINMLLRTHGAEKAFVKTMTKNQALARIISSATEAQLKDPEFIRTATALASTAAQDAVLRSDNEIAKSMSSAISANLRSPNVARRILGFTQNLFVPLRNMPANFVKQAADYTGFGPVRGSILLADALRKSGGEAIDRQAAAEIQRAFKRGGPAAIAILAGTGHIPGIKLGGYYVPGDKRAEGDLQPGEIEINMPWMKKPYRVDSAFTNSPVVVAAQLYATLMRQSPRMHSLGKALTASLLGLAEHGPGLISTEDALSKLKESRGGSLVGGLISEYEPSILKRAAAARDLQPGTGTPMGYFIGGKGKPVKRMNDTAISQIRQGIMSPLPYNRNELPTQASQSEASSGEGKHYGRHGRSRGIPRR